jgi:hypothetical protein
VSSSPDVHHVADPSMVGRRPPDDAARKAVEHNGQVVPALVDAVQVVATHVHRVLANLRLGSRVEAAVWASARRATVRAPTR